MTRSRLAIVAAMFVMSVGLAACGGEEATAPGDVVAAAGAAQLAVGASTTVIVPSGSLSIWSGAAVDQIAPDEARDEGRAAEPGIVWVPMSWRYDTERFDPITSFLATDATPNVDLVVDGHPYRVPPPSRNAPSRSFYVAVEDGAADLRLTIEFDGVTQEIDLGTGVLDPAAAAGMYELEDVDLVTRPCRAGDWFDTTAAAVRYSCEYVGPLLLPYANGSWAPDGQQWLAVQLSTTLSFYSTTDGVDGAHWNASDVTTELRLGSQEVEAIRHTRSSTDVCPDRWDRTCGSSIRAYFLVTDEPPRRLHVTQEYDLELHSSWGEYEPGSDRTVTATGSVDLRR